MSRALGGDEFRDLLGSFASTAFYLETQASYALDYEMDDFRQFLAGHPEPPTRIAWWAPWLEQIAALTCEGRQVSRVRVISDPPTGYQRWGLWALPWHTDAGEQVRYLTRATAERIGLPMDHDWWLLDGERVVILRYTADGHLEDIQLATDPATVGGHAAWRDLALRYAAPAAEITAA